MKMKISKNFDEYLENYPKSTQRMLKQMRSAIRKVAPKAEEKISYGLPTFTLNGVLVHFGAYGTHIGFYPGAAAVAKFKPLLKKYKTAKGTIRFELDQPLPLALVQKITKFRVQQNLKKKK